MSNRTRKRDRGFTLPEAMIAVTITAVIATVITTTISVTLRNLPATSARADSSVLVQGLTTWLPPDVDSTEPDEFYTDPGEPSGCAGSDPGINMLTLRWNETFQSVSTDYTAAYRFVDRGDHAKIVRLSCENGGTPQQLTMTGPLSTTLPTVVADPYDPANAEDDYVVIQLETLAGEQVTIEAATKNPDDALPYNPPPPVVIINNTEPYAAFWTVQAEPGTPFTYTYPAGDVDGDPIIVNHLPLSVPPELTIADLGLDFTVTPGPAAVVGSTYSFDYEVNDVPYGEWAIGTIFVEVVAAGTAAPPGPPSYSPPPCQVTAPSISLNPAPLKNSNPGKLKNSVTVSISVISGYCVGLHLRYDTGGPNGEQVQNFGSSPPYQITFLGHPHGTELWSSGPHDLRVHDGTGAQLSSATFNVSP